MKKYLFAFLAAFVITQACSDDSGEDPTDDSPIPERRTPIPDANFEAALVALGLDDQVDGSVETSRIEDLQRLDVSGKGISDLSGIEDFKALTDLNVRDNVLTLLDIRSNTNLLFIWAEDNALAQLLIGSNSVIEKVGASGNRLTSLKVTDYTSLQLLDLADNELTAMDVSTLPVPSFREFAIEGNPLTCILVSPQQLDNIEEFEFWTKDEGDTYSLDCE